MIDVVQKPCVAPSLKGTPPVAWQSQFHGGLAMALRGCEGCGDVKEWIARCRVKC